MKPVLKSEHIADLSNTCTHLLIPQDLKQKLELVI